jgi:hypothetical protein
MMSHFTTAIPRPSAQLQALFGMKKAKEKSASSYVLTLGY